MILVLKGAGFIADWIDTDILIQLLHMSNSYPKNLNVVKRLKRFVNKNNCWKYGRKKRTRNKKII